MRSFLMQDEYGQVEEAHFDFSGLDYPGLAPSTRISHRSGVRSIRT